MKLTHLPSLLSLAAIALPLSASAEIENDIQWGFEAVTGYRSNYIYRGFELSEGTLDFQLEAELGLSDHLALNLGGWYATETGSGEFDESAGFLKLNYRATDQLTLGTSATYRDFNQSLFESGVDLGAYASWDFCRGFGISLGAYYDTGADGWYGNLESYWTKPLSDKAYFALKTGVSTVEDYYERNGANDVYARASLTYHISDTVSITPFVGGSALLDSDDEGDDNAFGGVWFEVRF